MASSSRLIARLSPLSLYLLCLLCGPGCTGSAERARQKQVDAEERSIRALIDEGRYADAQSKGETLLRAQLARPADAAAPGDALDLVVEARWRNGDSSDETLRRAQRAVDAHRTTGSPVQIARSLRNLGHVLLLAVKPVEAVHAFESALSSLEHAAGRDDPAVADALDSLALGLVEVARYSDAERSVQRALRIREQKSPSDGPGTARTLELLSLASIRAGQYAAARPPLERALALRRQQGDHPDTATTYVLLGDLQWLEGHPAAARDAYAGCRSIAERALRPNHPSIAHCTRKLGNALERLGDMSGALALLEQAANLAERSLGSGHPALAGYLNDLAETYRTMTDYRRARALYERALAIRERQLGADDQDVATIVLNLALVSGELGDVVEARRQFERAIVIWRHRLGSDHPFVALAMTSLARVLLQHRQQSEALSLLRQALVIREHRLGPSHPETADALAELASSLLAAGRVAEAAAASRRATAIWEAAGSLDSLGLASALTLRANVLAALGDAAGAQDRYRRALAITERVLGADHPNAADLRVKVAAVASERGQAALAFEQALGAETAARRFLQSTVRYLPEREALTYGLKRPNGLNLMLTLVDAGEPSANVEFAFDAVIRARALVLDEMAARLRVRDGPNSELRDVWAAWMSARQRLANLAVRGEADRSSSDYLAALADTRREAEQAERTLAEKSAAFRIELLRNETGLDEIRAALPPATALVSFVRYDRHPRALPRGGEFARATSSYLAFVMTRGSPLRAVSLGPARTIDQEVAAWRSRATDGLALSRAPAIAERSLRLLGARLRARIWDPLGRALPPVDRILVVPDGSLHLVNLAALPAGSSYLIDQAPLIHYLTTERDLVQFAHEPPAPGRGLLALGGVSFDDEPSTGAATDAAALLQSAHIGTRSSCGSFQTLEFAPLPGTLKEVRDLSGLWNEIDGLTGRAASPLTGSGASERAFKTQAPGRRVLHIATHGFFLGGDCAAPAQGTRSVSGLANAHGQKAAAGALESPLLQAGLALSGANRRARAKPDEEDGILTAEEVASLNLDGVEWAVLSACDTGVGEIRAGEGVFGLRRAFRIAGARTIIMSLWPVEDQVTSQWMRALYEGRLLRRLTTAQAVREASLAVLRDRRSRGSSTHPFYWAAFLGAGDWH
jgi:CHAT domain-containing protein/tetratricopeptide (TPR) repeat protein